MAFWNRKQSSPATLVAAAAPMDARAAETTNQAENWQDEAWDMLDTVGEYSNGVTWLSNVLSRARLVPALAPVNPGDEPTPIDPDTNDPAVTLVESIAHGIGGQAELLRSATVHLSVPGEGWFVGQTDDVELSWKFYSRDEVRKQRGIIQIRVGENEWRDLPDNSLPVRVWRQHDRYHWRATSSSKAALPILRRLQLLNRKVDAQILSRLASNGMYWIPSEMDFPVKAKYMNADDPFVAELIDLASIAIKTPGSAQAAIPLFLRAAGDQIAKLRYDTFANLIDPELRADREFEIKRLSTAMDVPPEVLLGMAGVNHWTGWQIEESALKTTVTSLLELICWSLTTGYLRPALAALRGDEFGPVDTTVQELPNVDRLVWYDLSELSVRPDRSADAITLHGTLTINDAAALRETGFDEADLLTDTDEMRRRIGLKICEQPTVSTLPAGLELLGITLSDASMAALVRGAENAAPPGGNGGDVDNNGPEPVNQGDLPRNDSEQAPPSTNGDQPAPQPATVP